MSYTIFLLLGSAMLISSTTFFTILWYLGLQKKIMKNKLNAIFFSTDHQVSEEIGLEIEKRLDDIILAFKRQIPIVTMVLSKPKETELKETAKKELFKLVPAIHQRISQMTSWKNVYCKLFLISVVVGSLLGLLQVIILYSFGVR